MSKKTPKKGEYVPARIYWGNCDYEIEWRDSVERAGEEKRVAEQGSFCGDVVVMKRSEFERLFGKIIKDNEDDFIN